MILLIRITKNYTLQCVTTEKYKQDRYSRNDLFFVNHNNTYFLNEGKDYSH